MLYECTEAGWQLAREVRPLSSDIREILEVWDLACRAPTQAWPTLLEDLIRFQQYFWRVDDVGLIMLMPFTPGTAHVHISFWDGRLRGREGLCRQMALDLMHGLGLRVLFTTIPRELKTVQAFARRIGFSATGEWSGKIGMVAPKEALHNATPPGD